MPDPPTSKLPAPFGKYLLTELIAVGGMAEVYRAKIFGASGFEKEMVVKRILPKYARNPNFVQMLIDEAKIAVSLSHGNIVPIYELGEFEGSYYIAMEFVEGRTVLDILRDAHSKKHPLPWPYCLGLAAEVAKGLAYAHTRTDNTGRPLGLVHRDINPRNIVITPAGEVRILDFGIARASTKRHQTASGVIKGTPGYMSPEQMYGQPVDARSDIYCLGILVYELLTLRRLFPVWDVNEMRSVFEAGPIPLPSSIARHVSKEVDTVIMKALTQNVNERFQSAADFEEELRTTIARSGTAVTASGLAREIRAVDDAPGPRAPKTAPPVIESSASRPTIPMRASTGAVRVAPDGSAAPVAVKIATGHEGTAPGMRASAIPLSGVSPDAATRTQRAIDARPVTEQIPADQAAMAAEALLRAQSGAVNTEGPKTQPMPLTRTGSGPALAVDAAHSFVISLAEPLRRSSLAPVEPLPSSSAAAAAGHRAMVLAKNETLAWASNVGADAEMLALMKATGSAPGTGRRTLAAALVALVVVAAVAYALGGDDIGRMVQRALAGQVAELGVVTVKTVPSGAEVSLDGRVRGKTNMKITGVDITEAHTLVVTPKDKPPIEVKLERGLFQAGEDGRPTYIFERDFTPPAKP